MVPGAQGFSLYNSLQRAEMIADSHKSLQLKITKPLKGQGPVPKVDFPPLFVVPPIKLVLAVIFLTVICVLCLTTWKDALSKYPFCPASDDLCITSGFKNVNGTTVKDKDPMWYQTNLFKFGSIPVVSVLFTYCHIWLALWLTFSCCY